MTLLDPVGAITKSSGEMASANTFTFSTKPFEPDVGIGYWGYRWLQPEHARWLSRDPIGEDTGGVGLYVFVKNRALHAVDPFGLVIYEFVPESHIGAPWSYDENMPSGKMGQLARVKHEAVCTPVQVSSCPNCYTPSCKVVDHLHIYLNAMHSGDTEAAKKAREGLYGHEQKHMASWRVELKKVAEAQLGVGLEQAYVSVDLPACQAAIVAQKETFDREAGVAWAMEHIHHNDGSPKTLEVTPEPPWPIDPVKNPYPPKSDGPQK